MADVLFEEEQWFPKWVGALIGGVAGAAAAGATRSGAPGPARGLISGAGVAAGVLGLLTPMRTRVDGEGVRISFGLPGWIRFRIRAGEVRGAEAVTYRPLAEFGGWGIRFGREGARAYSMWGDRGVRVQTDRRSLLIGTQRPEELAHALKRLMEEHA